MNGVYHTANYGTLFSTLAALTSPGHEFVTSRPVYREVAGLRLRSGAGARLRALVAAWRHRQERARLGRALERLDDHLLRDIGVSRAQVSSGLLPPFAQPEDPALRARGRDLAGGW